MLNNFIVRYTVSLINDHIVNNKNVEMWFITNSVVINNEQKDNKTFFMQLS